MAQRRPFARTIRGPARCGKADVIRYCYLRVRWQGATKMHQSERVIPNDLPDVKNGGRSETGIWSDDKKVEAFGCVLTRPLRVPQHSPLLRFNHFANTILEGSPNIHSNTLNTQSVKLLNSPSPSVSSSDKALTSNMSSASNIRRSSRRTAAKGSRNRNPNDSEVRYRVPSSSSIPCCSGADRWFMES
jgi:hypothetical protein